MSFKLQIVVVLTGERKTLKVDSIEWYNEFKDNFKRKTNSNERNGMNLMNKFISKKCIGMEENTNLIER